MTHVLILQGTQSGSPDVRSLSLTAVQNAQSFGNPHLTYVARRALTLTRVVNANTIAAKTLSRITVRTLTLARVVNVNSFGAQQLAQVPFVPANAETTALLLNFDQTYTTTEKIQMDTLITRLKSAGVWAKLDWYGTARWAKSEHDALIDWTQPTRSLTKVGSASWTLGVGLTGVNPMTSDSRYKSGWEVGDGPHSTTTSFAFFCNITAISVPQNGMLPMGVWKLDIGGGPATPNGSFLSLSISANSGFAGANLMNGNGNTSFAPGTGLGVWGVSRSGGSQITVKDGATLESDVVTGTASYSDPEGMSVAGSAGLAKKSFPGTQIYWGWGAALTALEFAGIESAYQAAILPPVVITDALFVDDAEDWFVVDDSDNYLQTQ